MPEEPKTGETPEEPKQTGETPGGEGGEEKFDEGRAMELIRKLRAENKELTKGAKRAKELEDAEAQRATADLSEVEKHKQAATKAQADAETATRALQEATVRFEFMLAALRPGSGVDPQAAEAAWKLVEREQIEVDEKGQPKDVGKVLKELVRQYPFLAAKVESKAPNINADQAGKGAGGQTDAAKAEELKRRFRL